MHQKDLDHFAEFMKEFHDETDRGAALVGAAILDQYLEDILLAFLLDHRVSRNLVTGYNAPLGTFSARIKAAFSLGLIDKSEYHECEIIRKIRNKFAHSVHGITFNDEKINKLCLKLESSPPGGREKYEDNPRVLFINATILNVMALTYRSEWVKKERRVTFEWPF